MLRNTRPRWVLLVPAVALLCGMTAGGPKQHSESVPRCGRMGEAPRWQAVGIDKRRVSGCRRQSVGGRALRRESLRGKRSRSCRSLRPLGQGGEEFRGWHDYLASRHSRGSRGQCLDRRLGGVRSGARRLRACDSEVQPRGQAAHDAGKEGPSPARARRSSTSRRTSWWLPTEISSSPTATSRTATTGL